MKTEPREDAQMEQGDQQVSSETSRTTRRGRPKGAEDCRSAVGASVQVRSGCGEPRMGAGLPPLPPL